LSCFGSGKNSCNTAFQQNQDEVATAKKLSQFRTYKKNALAAGCKFLDDPVNIRLSNLKKNTRYLPPW
jgi:hypothetical protein